MKKKQSGKPIKIKLNKPRTCDKYSEDPLRVMADFRKRERHRKVILQQQERKAAIAKALREVEAARARVKARESSEVENG